MSPADDKPIPQVPLRLGAAAIFRDTSNYATAVAVIALSKTNPKA
jgi:hypothetical protein